MRVQARNGDGGGPPGGKGPAVALALIAAIVALSGCGGDGSGDQSSVASPAASTTGASTGDAPPTAAGGQDGAVEIVDFTYDPGTIVVAVGTEVIWSNSDEAPHTATSDDAVFDTGTLQQGDEGGFAFDEAGTYDYYCRFHAFMKGTVQVNQEES